ncbi:MAG: FtsQ-type POTRA domain-containing protein [Candidatus Pelagibacter sp.]|nr:FtsQ-type POTRA domain-containing protein [Candidatus Pelagibacter sp.]
MHQSIGKKNKIIVYLILLFILSTTSGKFAVSQNNYSSIDNKINIEGLSNIENLKISNELSNLFYKYIFFMDKKEINKIMNKYNLIEEYSIKRIYPSTINVKIKPTKYLARTSNDNKLLVGANGKLIKNEENNEILPYIFGEFNSTDFLALKKNIEQSKFTFKELKTLYFFQSNRWDILTNNDILIKLPLNNSLESLNLAYKIINNDEIEKKIIDLRVKNHLIIE